MKGTSFNSNRNRQRKFFIVGVIVLLALTMSLIAMNDVYFHKEKWQILGALVVTVGSYVGLFSYYRYVKYAAKDISEKVPAKHQGVLMQAAACIPILGLFLVMAGYWLFLNTGSNGQIFWWFVVVNVFAIRVVYNDHRLRVVRLQDKKLTLRIVH